MCTIIVSFLRNEHRTCPSLIGIYCQICYKATPPAIHGHSQKEHPSLSILSSVITADCLLNIHPFLWHVSCIYTLDFLYTRDNTGRECHAMQTDGHRLQFNYYLSGFALGLEEHTNESESIGNHWHPSSYSPSMN